MTIDEMVLALFELGAKLPIDASVLCVDAADALEAQAKEIDRLETKVDQLEWENKGVAEWRDVAKQYKALCDQLGRALDGHCAPFLGHEEEHRLALEAWREAR